VHYSEVFDAAPHAIGAARHQVCAALGEAHRGGLAERAALAVSELVTNAIVYAHGNTLCVELTVADDAVVLAVHDASVAAPVLRHVDCEAVGGRGLALVDAVADAWGYEPTPDGKRVWCRWETANA
jgi:anti-sigma regulatory factor (Ser/Thr protein kinase)